MLSFELIRRCVVWGELVSSSCHNWNTYRLSIRHSQLLHIETVYLAFVADLFILLYNYVKCVKKWDCWSYVALSCAVRTLLTLLDDAVFVSLVSVCEALAKSKPWWAWFTTWSAPDASLLDWVRVCGYPTVLASGEQVVWWDLSTLILVTNFGFLDLVASVLEWERERQWALLGGLCSRFTLSAVLIQDRWEGR